ncbi:MAG: Vpu [Candidatus Moeniiplasma glomeromycotorum]|nr:Vpu [Candidatus Moeniiplasma glomeromycotorum]MCE8167395.1 Vpu [Candidatus Moeniiplasma glomeromycotorum]MCE8168591.1 Vpu [Candidatus Moeniiplasma glomeromycotorum]
MSLSDLGWFILIIENLLLVIIGYIYLYRKCRQCKEVKKIDRLFQKLCEKCSQKEKEGREIKKF